VENNRKEILRYIIIFIITTVLIFLAFSFYEYFYLPILGSPLYSLLYALFGAGVLLNISSINYLHWIIYGGPIHGGTIAHLAVYMLIAFVAIVFFHSGKLVANRFYKNNRNKTISASKNIAARFVAPIIMIDITLTFLYWTTSYLVVGWDPTNLEFFTLISNIVYSLILVIFVYISDLLESKLIS